MTHEERIKKLKDRCAVYMGKGYTLRSVDKIGKRIILQKGTRGKKISISINGDGVTEIRTV
jgi:hypothetical protein